MAQKNCNKIIDPIGNTPFLAAAAAGEWEKVKQMLHQGANARHKNSFGQNALYFALCDNELDLAIELFDAGARLDALCVPDGWEDRKGKGTFLCNITEMRRTGRDIFYDEKNNIVDFCRWGFYMDAERKIEASTPVELSLALTELIRHARYMEKENLALAKKLLDHGAKLDIETLDRYASMRPAQLRNSAAYTVELQNYHPRATPFAVGDTMIAESVLPVGRFRAELDLFADGTLQLFLPYETEIIDFPDIPSAVSVRNVGTGLSFSVSDSRYAEILLNTVNHFSEGK